MPAKMDALLEALGAERVERIEPLFPKLVAA
jgi:hypothetical protein